MAKDPKRIAAGKKGVAKRRMGVRKAGRASARKKRRSAARA